ncbi:MAG: hypothetical protein R8G66_25450 [Cytophagales bacterium]|nr:hypothetical protein [Cytophagales bacterium]
MSVSNPDDQNVMKKKNIIKYASKLIRKAIGEIGKIVTLTIGLVKILAELINQIKELF